MTPLRKSIVYFEDDPEGLEEHFLVLKNRYDVVIGAHQALIEQKRGHKVDLVIVDLMIHNASFIYGTGQPAENILFKDTDTDWRRRGLEFLRRIRAGQYEQWGFGRDVPVIVASAVVSYPAQKLAEALGISDYLEKPFAIDVLEKAVEQALAEPKKRET